MAFEEGVGVVEVLFDLGLGGDEARKRFVKQTNNPLLLGERGDGNPQSAELRRIEAALRTPRRTILD